MIGLSKKAQTSRKEPLKQNQTKDSAFLSWMHSQGYGCIVCNNPQIELHHVKEHSSDVKNDHEVLTLCEFHHKYSNYLSPHGSPKKWREVYPIEVQRAMAQKYYEEYKNENMDTN